MPENPKPTATTLLKTSRKNLERAALSRARALNHAEIEANRATVSRVIKTFELLKFLRIPTPPITSNVEYISSAQKLHTLIGSINEQLTLAKNTIFANLSESPNGECARTQQNVTNLMTSIQAATTRIVEAASTIEPLERGNNSPAELPDTGGFDLNNSHQLRLLLEELRQFLNNFITRNKLDLAKDTALTVNELQGSHQTLNLLDQTSMVENIDPNIDPSQLDKDWEEILYRLALTLSIFEERLRKIHEHNADELILLVDQHTIEERIVRDTEKEHKLRDAIDEKDKNDRRTHIRLLAFFYGIITGRHLLPSSTPERLTLGEIQNRISNHAAIIRQRRAIAKKRQTK